jgi:hypothetical protein
MKIPSEQQMLVLQLIGSFGYLSTKDVAKLNWPGYGDRSAHVMAQTMLTTLAKNGYILARDLRQRPGEMVPEVLPAGVPRGYVLTKKGAAVLNEQYEQEWLDTPCPDDKFAQWFADGYNLSLADHNTRAPVIDLCHALLALGQDWTPVGRRAITRNFLGRATWAHFDAMLFTTAGKPVVGVYLAHPQTAIAGQQIVKLAKAELPFLICCDRPSRLPTLLKWRHETRPGMSDYIKTLIPNGLEA